jgi:hypothetical protein
MPEGDSKARIAPVDEVRLLRAASCDRRLSRGDLGVFAVLLQHCDDSWLAYPGIRRLSTSARLAFSNVLASIERLETFAYVRVIRRPQGSRQDYQVLQSPEIPESVPARSSGGITLNRSCQQEQSSVLVNENTRTPPTVKSVPVGRSKSVPANRNEVFSPTGTESTSNITLEDTEAESTREKPSTVILPDWIPADAWRGWKDHRKQVGRKFTEQAQRLAIRRLDALRAEGHDPRKLIDLAIESGWSSFNPRRDRTLANPRGSGTVGTIERDARTDEEIERANAEQLARFGLKDAA